MVGFALVVLVTILIWFSALLCDILLWPWTVVNFFMLLMAITASGLVVRYLSRAMTTHCVFPTNSALSAVNATAASLRGFGLVETNVEGAALGGVVVGAVCAVFHVLFLFLFARYQMSKEVANPETIHEPTQ